MLSPHKQKPGYFKRSSYMKIKMHVKENFFFSTKNGGLRKWRLFLILILAILCQKSLGLTSLDPKKVPHKRPLIKTHISCCQYQERSYSYLYTSIWSERNKVRKRRKSERERRKRLAGKRLITGDRKK